MERRARWMRFLEVESRVVWSAPTAIRAAAASVRPLRNAKARGVREVDAEGWLMEAGKMEMRYSSTDRDAEPGAWERIAAWRERLP